MAPARSSTKRRRAASVGTNDDNPACSPSSTPPRKRQYRGAGKKKQPPAPDFGEPRYRKLGDSLRQEVSKSLTVECVRHIMELLSAFQVMVAQQVTPPFPTSDIKQVQLRIQFCDQLEQRSDGVRLRARIQRYFELVVLADLFRKAKQAKAMGARSDNITQTFIKDLFPGSDPKTKRSTWTYYKRVGEALLHLVERFGWGVLLFPGINVIGKRFVSMLGEGLPPCANRQSACKGSHPNITATLWPM